MIDIQGELLVIKQQRDREYISIAELLSFLKQGNPNSYYVEIATYLLLKLDKNDIRKTDDELWGEEDFEQWEKGHGIITYEISNSIDEKPKAIHRLGYFFEVLETVKNYSHQISDLFKGGFSNIEDFLIKHDCNVFIKREQIENLLNIKTLDEHELRNKELKEKINSISRAFEKTDEFIEDTDINKHPVGTAKKSTLELRTRKQGNKITELEAEIDRLKQENAELLKALQQADKAPESAVDYNEFSIYGHSSELLTVLFETVKEFWADGKKPPKKAVVDLWIAEKYPVKDYPYIGATVRQYIDTIIRQRPK